MRTSIKYLLSLFSAILISACGGSGGGSGSGNDTINTQKSSDVSYLNTTILSANVNDATANDAAPEVSSNGLELFFHSTRSGGSGGLDLWVSTRNSTTDIWGAASNLGATINTTSGDLAPTISDDGLTLIFSSDRAGGFGLKDLYMITRPSLSGTWSAPVNLGNVINTQFEESGPEISTDGSSLYFFSDVPGGFGLTDLYVSTRASELDPWEPAINLGSTVNSSESDAASDIASDGLTLYFHSGRPGGPGPLNIWRTTRTSVNDAWNIPEVLPAPVNSVTFELTPAVSDDWQTLYFASDIGGNRDIWRATP